MTTPQTAPVTAVPADPDDGAPGRRRVSLIGSTGSIGTQGLDVIARNPGRFTVAGLAGLIDEAILLELGEMSDEEAESALAGLGGPLHLAGPG